MRFYHKTLLGEIWHGDSREYLADIDDNYFDLVLTDPPFGLKITQRGNTFGFANGSRKPTFEGWDTERVDAFLMSEVLRCSKEQVIFGGNFYSDMLPPSRCFIVWDKNGYFSDEVPFAPMEYAWASFDRHCKKYIVINRGFLRDSRDERTGHPTQKPSELFGFILRDFTTRANQKICDPFAGSGTTGVACERMLRRYVLIEVSEKYCEIAAKRVEREAAQYRLEIAE